MTDDAPANRLIREKSPYLLALAHQPVDWYPWGDEAFDRAKALDRPVFLSIGYATCHWCHVMAHESFEDPEIAQILNDAFVCVKVDREERPDVDQIYMTVCQLLTGSGGWPLTVIMTPDRRPFFAGTYFPKESRFGATGMRELVPRIASMWREKRGALVEAADQVTASLAQAAAAPAAGEVDPLAIERAYETLVFQFDPRHGGFGNAPKFPTPHHLLFLLRRWCRTGQRRPLEMVERTIEAIRRGGVYDQLGYGIHRYSTDARWLVPHFEKMLYDQALLILACTEAYQATGKQTYRHTAEETITYMLRELLSPDGAFYSAQDADSEGEEGKFYLWTRDEIDRALPPEEAEVFDRVFRVRTAGNFVDPVHPDQRGKNILYRAMTVEDAAAGMDRPAREVATLVSAARERLFTVRNGRLRPAVDDKVLTNWNGLAIAALAAAGRAFGHQPYVDAAVLALDAVLSRLRTPDNRLLHRYRDGEAGIAGQAEDYAFLVWGLLEVYGATFDPFRLATARALMDRMIEDFWDDENGGFFSATADAADLLVRQKEIFDGAHPSANSAAYLDLLRLARLFGDPAYDERAAAVSRLYAAPLESSPTIATLFLAGLDLAVGPSREVVVVGAPGTADTTAMLGALQRAYVPSATVLFVSIDEKGEATRRLAPFTEEMAMVDGRATAYVCTGRACDRPVTEVTALMERLEACRAT
jgi:uncharacterized protein YyaL (SSP411 family)